MMNAVFSVAAHFNFEVADALVNAKALESGVAGITGAAQQAQQQLSGMSIGLLSGMGLMPASIMGAVGASIKAAEAFEQSKMSWVNLITANKEHLGGPMTSFVEDLALAEKLMRGVYSTANKFGIDGKELEAMTKSIVPMFAMKAGVGGDTISEKADYATEFTRNLLKSAPNLGLDASFLQGQLMRSIEGQASMSDPLYRRLVAETPAMSKYTDSKAFNALDAKKRVDTLNEALKHFAKDTQVAEMRVNSITGQFNILKNNMLGVNSVLVPFGHVLRNLVVGALKIFNETIDGPLRESLKNVSAIAKVLAPDVETAFLRLRHLTRAQEEVDRAQSAVKGIMMFETMAFGWMLLGKHFPGVQLFTKSIPRSAAGWGFSAISAVFTRLPAIMRFLAPAVMPLIKVLGWLGRAVLAPLTAIMFFSNIISRAKGIAEVKDAKALPDLITKFTALGARITAALDTIFGPISAGMDWWAEHLSVLFTRSNLLEVLMIPVEGIAAAFEILGTAAAGFYAWIDAMAAVMGTLTQIVMDGDWNALLDTDFAKIYDDVFYETSRQMIDKMEQGKLAVHHNTKIDNVTIENKFKENLEPDRIAFTIKDQLQKLGQNALQGRAQPSAYPIRGR